MRQIVRVILRMPTGKFSDGLPAWGHERVLQPIWQFVRIGGACVIYTGSTSLIGFCDQRRSPAGLGGVPMRSQPEHFEAQTNPLPGPLQEV